MLYQNSDKNSKYLVNLCSKIKLKKFFYKRNEDLFMLFDVFIFNLKQSKK